MESQAERTDSARQPMTPETAALLRRKESLLLARSHLQQQLRDTLHPRHRSMLESALAELEKQLAAMG